ncbi:hypothetical protein BDR26DRAFT_1009498 [Obelidium mucronatum]|nr:hypothetical protein BDR26DRAFT_1009498 [Obelidium mucronatum]
MLLDPKREIDVNTLIREYLRYADYRTTTASFDQECGLRGRGPEGDSISSSGEDPDAKTRLEEVKNRFMIAFHDGNRAEFFKQWDQHFPPNTVKSDPLYQKLEFQVNVYFAVFPIHPFVGKSAAKNYSISSTMDAFKLFLETRGADLCKTTQFLSYYALPYVPDARAHPSFNEIFTERHVTDLESRLDSFLGSALRAAHVPRILRILSGVDLRPAQDAEETKLELKDLKHQIYELQENEREITSKHRGLQRDYHNLLTIASELVQTLAACINGEKITASYLGSICQRVGEFKKNSTVKRQNYDEIERMDQRQSAIPQSVHGTKQRSTPAPPTAIHSRKESNVVNHTRAPSQTSYRATIEPSMMDALENYLDYNMILRDMKEMGDEETFRKQAFVLQALRMRLTHAANIPEKRRILKIFLDNDVLGISSGQDIIIPLLQTGPHIVCEQLARFLNSITSESIGRDYILGSETGKGEAGITAALVNAMIHETRDSLYQQNLLGTLQKLSLRRSAQTTMNNLKVLEFLHTLLEKSDSLSDYSCEYGTALFMNLCLRTSGRKQCLVNPVRTVETLIGLLEIDSMQIQTYVNGALYSLLSEPDFRECAKTLRLNESLLYLQKNANEQVKGQINFVLEQMYTTTSADQNQVDDNISEDGEDEDEEDDDDDEEQEPEEDFDQLIPSFPRDKAGTDILLIYANPNINAALTSRSHSRLTKRSGTGGLAGVVSDEPLRRSTTTPFKGTPAVHEMKRPKTPTMRSITPALKKDDGNKKAAAAVLETTVAWPTDTNVTGSVAKGKKPVVNVPVTENEIREFNTGFSTRPKLARTPIN